MKKNNLGKSPLNNSNYSRSPLQELEVGPRSGPYLLVCYKHINVIPHIGDNSNL